MATEVRDVAAGLWIWRRDHPEWSPESSWDPQVTSTVVESGGEVGLLDALAPPDDATDVWERLDARPPTFLVVLKPDHVQEVDLAVQDVEGIDVVVVVMRVDAFPALVELEDEQRELSRVRLDRVRPAFASRQPLAVVGPRDVRVRGAVWLLDVDVVPFERPACNGMAEVLDEPAVGCVDVEIACSTGPGVRESVDDAGRNGYDRAGFGAHRLRAVDELECSLEDVERVDVLVVEVRAGALETRADVDLVDRDLRGLELDDDALVQPLALAGA